MIFWRKNKNEGTQDQEAREDKIIHHPSEPDVAPSTELDTDLDPEFVHHEMNPTTAEIIEDITITPTPDHTPLADAEEREELRDHSNEGGWLSRLTQGLSKSTGKLGQGIADILTKKKLDQDALNDLEDLLITADLGPGVAQQLVKELSDKRFGSEVSDEEVRTAMAESLAVILEPVTQSLNIEKPANGPLVILVCGVNGAGKTTTIGKMAHEWAMVKHKKVMIAAGDTFRAAAIDQLEVWANRAHVPLFKKDIGADAASVAFEAYQKAKEDNVDILMIDTAGRLQNKVGLMAELEKIVRVLKKQDESLPHATLLVLDATTGQNAHSQVKTFGEAVNVTGLIVTKLDGSAKGGVVVSLAREFGLPIHAIGVGEKAEDLSPFKAADFARALMGLPA
jgi:fused signal recognition particle receptor